MNNLSAFAILALLSFCATPASANVVLNTGWYFESANKSKISVNPNSFLIQQLNGNDCCIGKYLISINKNEILSQLNDTDNNVLYIPGIGGANTVTINGKEFRLKNSNFTNSGIVLPFPRLSSLPENFDISIAISGTQSSYFVGFSRLGKAPVIGEFMQTTIERDKNNYYQNTIPLFNSITLFVFSFTFFLIYLILNKKNSLYKNFSIALFTWAIFYLFLSGYIRELNFNLGSALHFPARTLASYGLFLLVTRAIYNPNEIIPTALHVFLFTILLELFFGWMGMPVYQSLTFSLVSIFSFYPLKNFRLNLKNDLIGNIIGVLGILVLIGQLFDSIKLHQGLINSNFEFPYLNRFTFLPLLLVSFGDAILQFSGSFHQLRNHLFKAKSYARIVLHTAKDGLSHDNVSYFLKVTSKICGFTRVSLAQKQEDCSYRIVKLHGSKFSVENATVDFSKTPDIKESVDEGKIVFGSVRTIADGWKTAEFVAVPVPEEKNPPYLMLLSDPIQSNLISVDMLPYLSQISSAIWVNLERTREHSLRLQTEKKFSSLVQRLDPSLYEFILNNMNKMIDPDHLSSSRRGIVFFDQKGYSTMTEEFDDITMGRFARIIGEWVTTSAARFGARVSSFAGDAFLLETFNIGAELDGSIALRTLDLVWNLAQGMGELNQILLKEGFSPVTFRFGAHIGTVAAANLDFIQKGLSNSIGDTVNVAARLQSLAKPGSIYVSGDLAEYVENKFMITAVPKQYVKGRMKRIDIYSLVGKVEASPQDAEGAA